MRHALDSLLHNAGQTVRSDPKAIVSALTLEGFLEHYVMPKAFLISNLQKDTMYHVSKILAQLKGR